MVQNTVKADSLYLRILSHNIRYATSAPSKNERPWAERCPLILRQFKYHTRFVDAPCGRSSQSASFICLQEVLHSQLNDLMIGLNGLPKVQHTDETHKIPDGPIWAHVGVAREDGETKGEYNPIIYHKQAFQLLDFRTKWLSPTPNQPSKGWDAGSPRILTVAVFECLRSRQRIVACNTHLDNEGAVARKKSIPIILETIQQLRSEWASANNTEPLVFLAGDFNSFPTQEAYLDIAKSRLLADVLEHVPKEERYGDEITFTGFVPDTDEDKDEIGRIDFVWIGPVERIRPFESGNQNRPVPTWDVLGYAVLPNVFDDGVFCSDHRCLASDVLLRGS
ncbi:MAG: hypothetical protein M1822_007089 [Bathelium mastoideum]|nr:MAG: hypothetical protein M1822_007089 [Bathelium mastoideum]